VPSSGSTVGAVSASGAAPSSGSSASLYVGGGLGGLVLVAGLGAAAVVRVRSRRLDSRVVSRGAADKSDTANPRFQVAASDARITSIEVPPPPPTPMSGSYRLPSWGYGYYHQQRNPSISSVRTIDFNQV
jgi:hypothetical protein